jgi:hypothetical protein
MLMRNSEKARLTAALTRSKAWGAGTVNAHKSNRRSLTMLAALVAIALLGNGVGLIIHYGLTGHSVVRAMRIADDSTSKVAASTHNSP